MSQTCKIWKSLTFNRQAVALRHQWRKERPSHLSDAQVRRKGMSESKSPRQLISSGLVFKKIRNAARVHRDAVNELLVEAQQPHGKGGSAEYANRKSDATTAATRAASAGDASRSMMSTTSDICGPRPERASW